jgi:hypothetical protein
MATSRIGHPGRSAFQSAIHGQGAHGLSHVANPAAARTGLAGAHVAHANAAFAGRRSFAANRQFAGAGAFHPFWNHGWHWHNHLGWIGPLFWPFAYGDFFYYALWPDEYYDVDPFWVYGYGDIYEGIFSPYVYDDYVQGSGAPARMAALTQSMTQSCDDEAAEVTGWPIDQIKAAVQPEPQQSALLDDLGNAVVKASDVIKSHCPTSVSFTPTGRLDTMQQRLQGLVQAVNIVGEPLGKFYDSLNDEQKARFNSIKPATDRAAAPNATAANATTPKSDCDASAMAWPTEQIDQAVQPNDAQRAKLDALQAAAAKGADIIKAACPSETPSTPPARLAAAGKHLQAMLQAVDTVRDPLAKFYGALSDDERQRFDAMGNAGASRAGSSAGGSDLGSLCGQQDSVTNLPVQRIEHVVAPTAQQQGAFDDLKQAAKSAADELQASCPKEVPQAPVARLDAAAKRLTAMIDAMNTVRPKLENFYASLSDEQKAKFNTMGPPQDTSSRSGQESGGQ